MTAKRTSQEHIANLERCANGSSSHVSMLDIRAAARHIADLEKRKPATPPTLARLEKAAIVWIAARGKKAILDAQWVLSECAVEHAAWKAKQAKQRRKS